MLKKKTIIFHVNNQEQYYGEFHINTKIRMLKSFFKDVSHMSQFKFIYNGDVVNNDELTVREMTRGSNSYEALIKISQHTNNSYIEGGGNLNISMLNLNNASSVGSINMPNLGANINQVNNNEELIRENYLLSTKVQEFEAENANLREQNESLFNELEDMRAKLAMVQKAYENAAMQNVNANKVIEGLKNEYQILENNYNIVKEKLERYQNAPTRKSLLINSGNNFSNVGNNVNMTTYSNIAPNETTPNATNNNILNTSIKRKSNILGSRVLTPDRFPNSAKKSIVSRTSLSSSNANKRGSLGIGKENGASMNNLNISREKKKSSLQSEKIVNGYNTADAKSTSISLAETYSVDLLKKTNSQLFSFKLIKSNSNSPWVKILPYLTPREQFNVLITNKENFNTVNSYWYDLTNSKLENINNTLAINKKKYSIILQDQHFQLSASANSALKILNNAKYLDIFSKDNEYFDNNNFLPIYKILLQFNKAADDNLNTPSSEFVDFLKNYFKEKAAHNGLGEFIKSLPKECDFSEDNIKKISDIMNFYKLATVDCGSLGKMCKTTGIISFFVKDALVYCGLDIDKKVKDTKSTDRVNVFKDNLDINFMKSTSEKILSNIESLLVKYKKE